MQSHQVLVYGALFLWILGVYEIIWSSLMFMLFSEVLIMMDGVMVTTFVFLSGVVLLPTNLFILHRLSNGKQLNQNSTLLGCPLWVFFLWVIIVNSFGVLICLHKMNGCQDCCAQINKAMKEYKNKPRAKRFIDDLQLYLNCCGKDSYKDWFNLDWYDRIQDYAWEPSMMAPKLIVDDSVPVSCCKTGFCIANYLTELGTHLINTRGCCEAAYQLLLVGTCTHFFIFMVTIIVQICVFRLICDNGDKECDMSPGGGGIKQIMSVDSNFNTSSTLEQTVDYDTDKEPEISSTINESGEEEKNKSKYRIFAKSPCACKEDANSV